MNARFLVSLLLIGGGSLGLFAQTPALVRLKFQAHDGDPGTGPAEQMTFQIKIIAAKARSQFVKIGDVIEGTRFRVTAFAFKESRNEQTGNLQDVSTLTIQHTETSQLVILPFNAMVDAITGQPAPKN